MTQRGLKRGNTLLGLGQEEQQEMDNLAADDVGLLKKEKECRKEWFYIINFLCSYILYNRTACMSLYFNPLIFSKIMKKEFAL